ncbi:hypothetical protein FRC11_002740, partial [Ceratobasidium sp. 423]
SSVEVERAFSFVSALVGKRRHRMAAYTIQSTATLGAYSRANLVPSGLLEKAYSHAREKAQAAARAKAAEARMHAAVAEAEAAAAAESLDEEESEDDEDVLGPSSDFDEDGVLSDDE